MTQGDSKSIIPSPGKNSEVRSLLNQLKLILRLLGDDRVNVALKALPLISVLYLISPFDFAMLNPIDDAVVLGVGLYTFVELCPDDVVEEHRQALAASQRAKNAVDGKARSDS
ncbi:MAG: hypothetical protein DWG76_02955 [Chloroflexi bacterium]|nr:hypothetical protein [Chloroflexota bacterium]MQC26393.1 hypothetical protein [Chloroflexota bacterium]